MKNKRVFGLLLFISTFLFLPFFSFGGTVIDRSELLKNLNTKLYFFIFCIFLIPIVIIYISSLISCILKIVNHLKCNKNTDLENEEGKKGNKDILSSILLFFIATITIIPFVIFFISHLSYNLLGSEKVLIAKEYYFWVAFRGFLIIVFTYFLIPIISHVTIKKFKRNELENEKFKKRFKIINSIIIVGLLMGSLLLFINTPLINYTKHIPDRQSNLPGILDNDSENFYHSQQFGLDILGGSQIIVFSYSLFVIILSLFKAIRLGLLLKKDSHPSEESNEKNKIIMNAKYSYYYVLLLTTIVSGLIMPMLACHLYI